MESFISVKVKPGSDGESVKCVCFQGGRERVCVSVASKFND